MFELSENITRAKLDPKRLCPMLAGPAVLAGSCLIVRLPEASLEIRGQAHLLRKVVDLCDGTRSLLEAVDAVPGASREAFRDLLMAMLDAQALIDSARYVAKSLHHGNLNSPFGRAVADEVSREILLRKNVDRSEAYTVAASPLDDLVKARTSARTFDAKAISFDALRSLLWILCGVVDDQHGWLGEDVRRRTIASGGALNLIQPYVALRLPVGPLVPGIYRIGYPGARQISFARLDSDIDRLPLTIAKPGILTHATGMVFLLGDADTAALRYRNRAVRYLFMEAGAALQNLALCAEPLGAGAVTIGGHDESEIGALCHDRAALVLAAAVIGSAPSQEQIAMLRERSVNAQASWMPSRSIHYSTPMHRAVAKAENVKGESPFSWGRDRLPWLAHVKALAEAVEREAYRVPRDLQFGAFRDFDHAVEPSALVAYSARQLADPTFPFAALDATAVYPWIKGVDTSTGRDVLVPSDLIFSRKVVSAPCDLGARLTHPSSSGCAAGHTQDEARDRALLEVVERDAFMRHWLRQCPGVEIGLVSLPKDLFSRVAQLIDCGWTVVLQQLTSSLASTVCASAQHGQLGKTCVAAASSLQVVEAIEKALSELESAVFGCYANPVDAKLSAAEVKVPGDHAALYCQRRYFRRADAMLRPAQQVSLADAERSGRSMASLAVRAESAGLRPIFVDITPHRNAIDQGRTALMVAKCLVPGLVPISFGAGLEPRGMVSAVHPRSFFPHPFS